MASIIVYGSEPNSFVDLKLRVRRERKERERIEVEEGKEKMEIQLRNTRPCVVKILLIASRQLTAQKRMSS